jgi:hypothetical protein
MKDDVDEDDEEEIEYPDDAPPVPGVPIEFLPPSFTAPIRRDTFLDGLCRFSEDTQVIDTDDKTMPASTASKLASSFRRHLNMRTMREKFSKTAAFGRTLRLPGHDAKELTESKLVAGLRGDRGEAESKDREGSLARRLFGRGKKPKRPKVPEGWLFGPPPE